MVAKIPHRLKSKTSIIMNAWEKRVCKEIEAAQHQGQLALRNSLPEFLAQICDLLSQTSVPTQSQNKIDREAISKIGKIHGKCRAGSLNYTIDQLISEYHIFRQVICHELEKDAPMVSSEYEIIVSSIEHAVNDAATEFSNTLRDIQDQLSHTLAHDLRNPLTTARLSAQLILRRPEDVENCVSKAGRISICIERIDKMISDLLDASRIRAGQSLTLDFKKCDLDWVAREVIDDLNFSTDGHFILKSIGPCFGNWNENGKYGDIKRPVTISIIQDLDTVSLSVHNEGDPILPGDKDILFQQFRRAKSVEKKVGWGLGLTVVQGIVDGHHGRIVVHSEKELGTTFSIFLPKDPTLMISGKDLRWSEDQNPIH
jgi:signal transduction histidine kinase